MTVLLESLGHLEVLDSPDLPGPPESQGRRVVLDSRAAVDCQERLGSQ